MVRAEERSVKGDEKYYEIPQNALYTTRLKYNLYTKIIKFKDV